MCVHNAIYAHTYKKAKGCEKEKAKKHNRCSPGPNGQHRF